jgi:hypothetical protein
MGNFRYETSGRWYKGNTHIHSVVSDGGLNFSQLADLYAGAGFDFLFRTDHWIASDAEADRIEYPLLWLDGIELDGDDERGFYFHIACLGSIKGINRGMGLEEALRMVHAQDGLIILAHPHWTGNQLEEALRLPLDGVEVYNNVCQNMNGKGYAGPIWDGLLDAHPHLLAFASDDAHIHPEEPGWNGGWIVANAAECTRPALIQAIRTGNYYSSTGPDFKAIEFQDGRVQVSTSAVKYIRLVGPGYRCQKVIDTHGCGLSEAEFKIPQDWKTVYIQIEDDVRRLAWTNPLFFA